MIKLYCRQFMNFLKKYESIDIFVQHFQFKKYIVKKVIL